MIKMAFISICTDFLIILKKICMYLVLLVGELEWIDVLVDTLRLLF